MTDERHGDTTDREYTERLVTLTGAGWKQKLDVQRPYRWNLQRLMGERRVLDVGCGIGRQLGLAVTRTMSFPFPRMFGRLFVYNEFVVVATVPRT